MAATDDVGEYDVDQLSSVSNVLLLAPSLESVGEKLCAELLAMDRPSEENVLAVSLTDSPDDWLDAWRRRVGQERPANTCFVTAGETRSATQAIENAVGPANVTLRGVSSPADLTGIGMRISEQLADWEDDDNTTVVDFDSLSILLEYSDQQSVFKFMHVLTGRIDAAGAHAHYHMDPGVHDQQVISTFTSLMDAVVEVEEGGDWTIKSR